MAARPKREPRDTDAALLQAEMDRANGLRAERDALADLLREAKGWIDGPEGDCDCETCHMARRIDAMLAALGTKKAQPKGGRK